MPSDPQTLARYASLKREDRDALLDLAKSHPEVVSVDETRLREITMQAASDRLAFAERLVAFARAALESKPGDDDVANRQALMVAYDAIHHALRAMNLGLEGWDPIGHQETLDAAGESLGGEKDLGHRFEWLNLGRPLPDAVSDLRTQRQAAEWDVYNVEDEGKPRVDFATEAPKAVKLAGDVVRTVKPALYDRLAGEL